MPRFGALARGAITLPKPSFTASRRRSWPRQRPVLERRKDCEHDREVGGRLGDAHPADRIDEHVLVVGLDAGMPVQHRQQQRQAGCVQADGEPPRLRRVRRIDQRLDLDEHRTTAFLRHQHAGARHRLRMLRQEQRGRVADDAQAAVGHCEDPQLVDRAEAVLDGAHEAEGGMVVALEVEHGVDHVLQHAWPGERAFLGDVADHDHGDALLLGHAGQLGRAIAHLCHRPRRRLQLLGEHRLDRVDNHHRRSMLLDRGTDPLQRYLRQHRQARTVDAQPVGAQRHLAERLLAGDVEDLL